MPSAEHGKYYMDANPDDNATSLVPMDQIGNGQVINFHCDPGYNIQVGSYVTVEAPELLFIFDFLFIYLTKQS